MPPNKGTRRVVLDGRGPLTLREADHIHTGGEGVIYRARDTVVKIYLDPKKMQRDSIPEKIRVMAQLRHPYLVIPEGIVLDANGQMPIGIYLPFVEGEHLPPLFTNSFRIREHFGDKEAGLLAERKREAMEFVHGHDALMIDPNPINWRVVMTPIHDPRPKAIDTDSWSIGRWQTSAVMPSIRDWHTTGFNRQTDFFSWGVVTFELFTGIHPYQGVLDGYRRGDFESRMKDNASVFIRGIRLNDNVRDFSCIPSALRAWYEAEFQQGERSAPPSVFAAAVTAAPAARIVRATTTISGVLILERFLININGKAIRVWPCGAVLFDSHTVVDLKSGRVLGRLESSNGEIVRVDQGWLFADWVNGNLSFSFVDERTFGSYPLSIVLNGYKLVQYENRLFVVTANELVELAFLYVGRPILSTGMRTPILQPNATDWFSGVGIQNALGAMFLVTPFGDRSCVSVRVRELDGLRPVAAKAGNRFVAVIAVDKNGQYRKLEFSFNRDYTSYTLWEGGTDNPELNMAILARGVCATITNDGELVIFVPSNSQINRVLDKTISTGMSLANWGDKVMYILDSQVWSIRLK